MKAPRDDLTELHRSAFDTELDFAMRATPEQQSYVAAVFIDLDGLSPVNDIYGHSAGDHVFHEVAR